MEFAVAGRDGFLFHLRLWNFNRLHVLFAGLFYENPL